MLKVVGPLAVSAAALAAAFIVAPRFTASAPPVATGFKTAAEPVFLPKVTLAPAAVSEVQKRLDKLNDPNAFLETPQIDRIAQELHQLCDNANDILCQGGIKEAERIAHINTAKKEVAILLAPHDYPVDSFEKDNLTKERLDEIQTHLEAADDGKLTAAHAAYLEETRKAAYTAGNADNLLKAFSEKTGFADEMEIQSAFKKAKDRCLVENSPSFCETYNASAETARKRAYGLLVEQEIKKFAHRIDNDDDARTKILLDAIAAHLEIAGLTDDAALKARFEAAQASNPYLQAQAATRPHPVPGIASHASVVNCDTPRQKLAMCSN